MNYREEVQNAIRHNIIADTDVYDYHETPLEQLLENYYNFCRTNLDIQAARESLSPNFFLFTNYYEINARAIFKDKTFTITINLGLLQHCHQNYYLNESLNSFFENAKFESITKFDNKINILAFQICTEFTYYHELAHLFQFTKLNEDAQIQERVDDDENKNFDKTYHILEINADTFAAISVSTHIIQYIDSTFQNANTYQTTVETITILSCCLLNYILNFSGENEIYFDKYKHPHPFIRQLNILMNISHYVTQSPTFQKQGIQLDGAQLFLTVIDTYKELESNSVFQTDISAFIKNNQEQQLKIVEYLNELQHFNINTHVNALEIWNKYV